MKILTCEQTRILEKNQVDRGSTYFQLMNNAGVQVGKTLISQLGANTKSIVAVLCGKGNNGGDGFIASQYLTSQGIKAYALLVDGEPRTEDSMCALEQALSNGVEVVRIWEYSQKVKDIISTADYVIDAIYGIGFKGSLNDSIKNIADLVNNTHSKVLAVDIPSGVNCDNGAVENTAFKADITLSFSTLKPCHVLYPSMDYCGKTSVAQVGINKGVIYDSEYLTETIDGSRLKSLMPQKEVSANKGTTGTLTVACGSYGMVGATQMCIQSALRSGTGLVKSILPSNLYPIIAPSIPQAVFIPYTSADTIEVLTQSMEKSKAVIAGCGLGNNSKSQEITEYIISNSKIPVILDADSLNVIANNIEILKKAKVPVIITPHPGEMARMLNTSVDMIQNNRLTVATEFAKRYNVIVVLKGAYTIIAHPSGKSVINPTGNKGMAKAGSGDVLAGIIGSFVSQGMSPFNAAVSGVYCHGYAGDLAEERFGHISMLATDIIDMLPTCIKNIYLYD
ncbi:MAG: NAD(P)H-hydrate dehydratase [Acutalibacteraceae bacterium]|nr:NAD(P)H-hydrate dehydratase [Acutalibacteraceae bacterium]